MDANILESSQKMQSVEVSFEFSKGKVFDKLSRSFKGRATAFCQGTRVRPEGRAPYLHLLNWLAQSDDWTVSIKQILRLHPEHRGSIIQVAEKGYLAALINAHTEISSVLHYDEVSQLLTVEDPQFMYYIRNLSWNKFAKDIGFDSIGFSTPYDFALSFAGEDREIAKMLFDKFEERETHVFYDKNEQHRILAQDVEDYLRPIYQTDAAFVVVLLSTFYPKKIWCKFESNNFKQRFKEASVIPIWFDEAKPGLFDETSRVGGISFTRAADIGEQLDEIVELCCKKLQEYRSV
ncbi:MAG: TIR domain-containing protein [Methylovulum miyakonense]|uniref:TIR domain-containing protein n=1 Tax=Methylovulum miyakonense TaxID=645578 RepID=UPI003BB69B8F